MLFDLGDIGAIYLIKLLCQYVST